MPDAFFKDFLAWVTAQPELNDWASDLPAQLENGLAVERWGDLPQWQSALDALPNITPRHFDLTAAVTIGAETDLAQENRPTFRETLMQLHPWRKGPFHLFGTHIDTEWRSDWKWDRIAPHLANLHGNLVLDVGCGNGYHCLRLLGAGAKRVVGIDPSAKFVYQFQAIKKYLGNLPVDVLPLGIEQMPPSMPVFDTVLSMGVLYHRKDPVKHIQELRGLTKPGGQILIETLIVEGDETEVLIPEGRYAKMRNVWAIPAIGTMTGWMREAGLTNPEIVDICPTTTKEQRRTDWMHFESLADFLDPEDNRKTIEGYPAPVRGVFVATSP